MSTKHRWLALVVALSLLVGALAPATAFAARGGRPIDSPGEPIDPPLEYGDPDPGNGGSPMLAPSASFWREVLLASMRLRIYVASPVGFTDFKSQRKRVRQLPGGARK